MPEPRPKKSRQSLDAETCGAGFAQDQLGFFKDFANSRERQRPAAVRRALNTAEPIDRSSSGSAFP